MGQCGPHRGSGCQDGDGWRGRTASRVTSGIPPGVMGEGSSLSWGSYRRRRLGEDRVVLVGWESECLWRSRKPGPSQRLLVFLNLAEGAVRPGEEGASADLT